MAAANPNYDEILATTLAHHRPQMIDNVFSARPLTFYLMQAGQVRMVGGGHKIVEPVITGLNVDAGSYSGADTLATTKQEGISAAEYDWGQYAVSVYMEGIEEGKNASDEAILSLLQARIMQAEETVKEKWDEMFFGDGTGNSNKDWNGLANLVAQNASAVGGIDPSVAANNWASYIEGTAGALTQADMATAYNTASVGADQTNLILTTQTLYEKYESLLLPNLRYQDAKAADGGFQSLMFKGAPVLYDTYCTAGSVYFLNTKYIRLTGHSAKWFTPTPFVTPTNQDIRVAQILSYGNLGVSNRSKQGVLTGRTA